MSSLAGGVAVVTGGAGTSAGLGQALVRRLAAEEMRVAVLDVDERAATTLADELRGTGADVVALACDVLDETSLQAAAAEVRDRFGACNVLCAHVGGGAIGPVDGISVQEWRDTFGFVIATMATIDAFLPLMRTTSGHRRIVLTSSVVALSTGSYLGGYRAAKAALTSIGETLDLELGAESIGTTISFPGSMADEGALAVDEDLIPVEMRPLLAAMTAEVSPEPVDVEPATVAVGPIIDAIKAGKRYVITHGAAVERNYRRRHEAIDEALADLRRRRDDD